MLWSPNCQLLYPFENQANDYSGNARHGTVFGSGVYATKPNGGRCLYFDGVGDYVATPSFGLSGSVVVFACDVRCKYKSGALTQGLLSDTRTNASTGYLSSNRPAATDNLSWGYSIGDSSWVRALATDYFASPYNDVWLHLMVVCDYAGKNVFFYRNAIPFGSPISMTGTPLFPSIARVKWIGVTYLPNSDFLTDGYLANVQLWTLATMPAAGQMLANVNRLMLGMNPIW